MTEIEKFREKNLALTLFMNDEEVLKEINKEKRILKYESENFNWLNLIIGDKIKIRKEIIDIYKYNNFINKLGWDEILTINKISSPEFGSSKFINFGTNKINGNFTLDKNGYEPYSVCPNKLFFEIIELKGRDRNEKNE